MIKTRVNFKTFGEKIMMSTCTNLMKFKFKCIKRSRFEKGFSPEFLESTLVFLPNFSRFVLNFQKFQFLNSKITDF
jgi:hypothetical protein